MCDDLLYPPIEPYNTGFLEVSTVHTLYFEECGNRKGTPVVFLHGGPGAGISERDRRYFDPDAYHVVLFDQRGCGKSTPALCLQENDTWNLVADIEQLRKHLGISKWIVVGGSWGSTLALLYAETHIEHILAMVIHGIFTFRKEETNWIYQEGASNLFPDFWEEYLAPIPEDERGNLFAAYYKRLTGDNAEEQLRCARARAKFEMAITQLVVNPEKFKRLEDPSFVEGVVIDHHYFVNNGFLKSPNQILDNAHIIQKSGISVTIIQGRYDLMCPAKTAWELYKKIPNAEFHMIPAAGHSPKDGGITKMIVDTCDKYKNILK